MGELERESVVTVMVMVVLGGGNAGWVVGVVLAVAVALMDGKAMYGSGKLYQKWCLCQCWCGDWCGRSHWRES